MAKPDLPEDQKLHVWARLWALGGRWCGGMWIARIAINTADTGSHRVVRRRMQAV